MGKLDDSCFAEFTLFICFSPSLSVSASFSWKSYLSIICILEEMEKENKKSYLNFHTSPILGYWDLHGCQ